MMTALALILAASSLTLAQSTAAARPVQGRPRVLGKGGRGPRAPSHRDKPDKDDWKDKLPDHRPTRAPEYYPYPMYYPMYYPMPMYGGGGRYYGRPYSMSQGMNNSMAKPKPVPKLPSAKSICVENQGGFLLSFELWDTATNEVSKRSGSRPSGGRLCMDLSTLDHVKEGNPVVGVVYAVAGISRSLPPYLYSPQGWTANFTCTGSVTEYSCGQGTKQTGDQPGARVSRDAWGWKKVHAKEVCMENAGVHHSLRFRLWDTATAQLSAWSQGLTAVAGGGAKVCVEGSTIRGVSDGNPVAMIANPHGGMPATFPAVVYDSNATTSAVFVCSGPNHAYECRLRGSSRRLFLV